MNKRSYEPPQVEKNGKQRWIFFAFCLVSVAAFFAGTRVGELDISRVLDPLSGIERSNETLDLSSVQKTYQYLQANFDGDIDQQALIDGANRGLVDAAGDVHTEYMNASEARQFEKDLSGDVGAGIGAEIGVRSDQPTIIRLLEGNPAKESGLKAGDTITQVNDESVVGEPADKVATMIRGEAGTTVKLVIIRAGEDIEYSITREKINNPSVSSEVKNKIGIIKISRFDGQTGSLARKAAEDLVRQNVTGIIVDIRSDGGGYLSAAVDVAGLWLNKKVVVTQKQRGAVIDTQTTSSDAPLEAMKTVVLVNGGTASASEILASSLRDYGAATLIGEKTFGKGSVQQIINLDDSALLKITVAHWYTPKDKNLDENGLIPDQVVSLSDEDVNAGRDPQLDAALRAFR